MEKNRVLFVTQEMNPYLSLTKIANVARALPQHMQEAGMEIRVLMPRFGTINERRHRLHEVVRLSGINIVMADDDYPLMIKVASMPGTRMQVYFLDNEDFFKRKTVFRDEEKNFHPDNAERMIFFCKGVLETVKKFGWAPDIVHLHGWMTSILPLYLKTAYKNDPIFMKSKVVYSLYDNDFSEKLNESFLLKAPVSDSIDVNALNLYKNADCSALNCGAIQYSDGVILGSPSLHNDVTSLLKKHNKPTLDYREDEALIEACPEFYESLLKV
jgi:starch synthase